MIVEDNGPGIVKAQVPNVFGRLLYGSKFHRLRQSRGQQGIGISAAGMYGQLTTGHPIRVRSKTGPRAIPHEFDVRIDTAKNKPITNDRVIEWDKKRGTEVAALFYTLLESAKLTGVDPALYLKAATESKLRFDRDLLPHQFRA